MLKQLKKMRKADQNGFTIIEVLIVLAIAGLIMVVVFLAVPALQRSGRNNALNTDANNVLTSVGNYISNNNGTLPTGVTLTGTDAKITGASGANPETAKVDSGVSALTFYNGTGTALAPNDSPSNAGAIQVVVGSSAKCNSTASGLAGGGSPRSYAVLYVAESGNGNILKCVGA